MASIYPVEKNILLDALADRIRQGMKEKVIKLLEPELNAVVEEAMGSLKTSIEKYYEHYGRDTIHVIVENKV